jgi:alpha-tubulin suppressor-like RCC1 family protein
MKRLPVLPLALSVLWFAACTHDLTAPAIPGPQTARGEATTEAFVTASVVTGWLHSCALTSDGTAYCWGDNGYGQLGSERLGCFPGITCTLTPTPVRGELTFTSLTAGAYHTCGITPAGELHCWGLNDNDQLGVETNEFCIAGLYRCSSTPLRVTGGIRAVDGGFTHTCALASGGQPYCWGGNLFGQLGVSDTNNRSVPTEVHGRHTFASIETGGYHTCALTAEGVAYCWGGNDKGQLGAPSSDTCNYHGAHPCSMTPIPVSGGLRFASLDLGHLHTCGIVPSSPAARPAASGAQRSAAAEPTLMLVSHNHPPMAVGIPGSARPAAPSNLQANAVSSSLVDLQWSDNSLNEDGFEVWRTEGGGPRLMVARLAPNATRHTDTGLQPSTTYTYGVVAFNPSGYSNASNLASATTHPQPPPPAPPSAPSNLQASAVSSSRIDLRWSDNAGNEDGFEVWRTIRGGQPVLAARLGPDVTDYSDTGLQAATTYFYGVAAFNAAGSSGPSNSASARTHPAPPPPAAPSALLANAASASRVDLTWSDNAGNEDGFRIERHTGNGNFAPIATVAANVTSFSDTDASPASYSYRVQAYNAGGASAYSNTATKPADPSGLTATAVSTHEIALAWSDNSGNEDGFIVERKTGAEAFVEIARTGADATAYLNRNVQSNTTYTYRVRAFIWQSGASGYTNEASATTPGAPVSGNAYCWGLNVRGQLGVNSLEDFISTPTRVHGGLDFGTLTTGQDHTCGIAADGQGYCWGWNGDGQFGNGSQGAASGSRVPVEMGFGLTWQALKAGEKHSCGISSAGDTYCWGQNYRGQIGDGTRNNWRLVPTLVANPPR